MSQRILSAPCWFGAVLAAAISMSTALAQVGAPQLGWVPDGARIRPVYGMSAAAAVGAVVPSDQDFSRIAASPARNYVLVSSAATGIVSVYTPEHGLVAVDGAGAAPDSFVLSPRGSAAALWFASISQVQVVTGLPDAPSIRQIDASLASSSAASAPVALAVSDDGAWVAGSSGTSVYVFGPNGEVNSLPVGSVTALTFFQGTNDLAVAGPAGLQKITGVGGFATYSALLTSDDASLQPVALAVTSDNRTLILADLSGSITSIDIGSGVATVSSCACVPEGLFGMGPGVGPSTFRLTGLADGAFKLFDATRGEVLFAPLALTETQGAAQ
jgi:hypothetical protein